MKLSVAHGSHIDCVLTYLFTKQDDILHYCRYVESVFSDYIQECTYREDMLTGSEYEFVFRSEQKMTEFLLKWS